MVFVLPKLEPCITAVFFYSFFKGMQPTFLPFSFGLLMMASIRCIAVKLLYSAILRQVLCLSYSYILCGDGLRRALKHVSPKLGFAGNALYYPAKYCYKYLL